MAQDAMATMEIRAALPIDAPRLTEIAHAAKRHWGYEGEVIDLWRGDLTVTEEFVATHAVYCAAGESEVLGFYALSHVDSVFELEHMWVEPAVIGAGVGRSLFEHAVRTARALGGSVLRIASDPHAEGFYRAMGANLVGEVPSKPEGRTLPLLEVLIESSNRYGTPASAPVDAA